MERCGMCGVYRMERLSHGAAPEAARCDLFTLSTPDGDKRNQTGGADGAQTSQIHR
jgi:hypothetical protein